MSEDPIKAKAELIATQYMLANLYASTLGEKFGENALQVSRHFADSMRQHLQTWTVPGLDAALSDHLTAEIQESIEFQLALIEELLEAKVAAFKAGQPSA